MRVIKDNKVIDDNWQIVEGSAIESGLPAGDVILPFSVWQSNREAILSWNDRKLGLLINGEHDIDDLAGDLDHFNIIAIEFPAFKDGRGYSQARILRDHYDYSGDLRAVGDVLRDQLYFMQRCGISSFLIKEEKDIEDAIRGFSDFSVKYQTAADGAEPLYKQR
ncbi:MAG: DUF934 domain-containing protein [Gammaproteobacteria bacterium]|nr:DUF934 domain-containing protein [Gammaproteobacteria bacterium]